MNSKLNRAVRYHGRKGFVMSYERVELATKKFCVVRDELTPHTPEYRLAFKKPLKFYLETTAEQAIKILKQEVAERV